MMKKQPIYQVDAFSTELFGGNPAAVCPLSQWLSDQDMQSIATENNLSETAFFVRNGEQFHIRWFTPNSEVALCGHATLASAFIIFEYLDYQKDMITFKSHSGELRVQKYKSLLQMDFPALSFSKINPPSALLDVLNIQPSKVYESNFDWMFVLESEQMVKNAKPDMLRISELDNRGIILTSKAAETSAYDVYSRCFYPGCDVPEDPVTGSAHCVIAPYWCQRLGQNTIHAKQGQSRQGDIYCEVKESRVFLSGSCRLYMNGYYFTPKFQN